MYKRLINQIVDEKVNENNQARLQQNYQKNLETTKYNSNKLMVGYVSTIIVGENEKLTKMTLNAPKVFMRTQGNMLYDIETGKRYPLIMIEDSPTCDTKCVLERDLELFVSTCLDAIDEIGVKYGAFLTKNQAREILDRQLKLNSLIV